MNSTFLIGSLNPAAALPARSQIASCLGAPPSRASLISQFSNYRTRLQHRQFASTSRTSLFGHFNSDKSSKPTDEPAPYYSPHQPKRQWPPDISKLSQKHQFRLERRYRRRAALKWERPRWKKWTKIVQYGLYAFIIVYAVFWLDWEEDHPIGMFRDFVISSVKSAFTPLPPPESLRKTDVKAKESSG